MTVSGGVVREATPTPCVSCPWRASNQGKRTPGGWYSKANLRRLWAGLRAGERMTCHPTDPRMSDMADEGPAGFRAAPETAETRECAGAVILTLREVDLLQRQHDGSFADYRRARPRGLTRSGVAGIVERVMFRGFDTTRYNLAEPDITHPDLVWQRP